MSNNFKDYKNKWREKVNKTKERDYSFKSASGDKVKITDSTNGLEMQLTVTDIGYGIAFDGNGEPEDFGSMPFKPVFTTF